MYKIISTNEVNDRAAAFIVPDQKSFRQKLLYNTLNTALNDKSSPKDHDVKVLTKDQIDSFAKQKSAVMKNCHGRTTFIISALCITAAAVAVFTLAYFFAPVILFAVAGALVVAGLTLAGLAISRHIEYNKKIKALADMIIPVKQQLAMAQQFGNIKSLPKINYALLSNAAKAKTDSTDLMLLGEMNEVTQQCLLSKKIDEQFLISLFTSFIPHLTMNDKSSCSVLDFYKVLLIELEELPLLDKEFSAKLVECYELCASQLKKGADLSSMIETMKYINNQVLTAKKMGPVYLVLESNYWKDLVLLNDGKHQFADIKLAVDISKERMAYFTNNVNTCPKNIDKQRDKHIFVEYIYNLRKECIPAFLKIIEEQTAYPNEPKLLNGVAQQYKTVEALQEALRDDDFATIYGLALQKAKKK